MTASVARFIESFIPENYNLLFLFLSPIEFLTGLTINHCTLFLTSLII